MIKIKRNRNESVDDSLYDMSGDEYTEDEEYMNDVHPKVVQWFKNFTKAHKLWNGVEKKNIAIIEDIADSEVVPEDIVDDCNSWVESDYYYSLGYLDYDIVDLCKEFLYTYTYPTNEEKNMLKIKRSRKVNESVGDATEIYAEANELFYKALSKYRRAKMKAINDGLDPKLLNRLGRLIENFSDAGNRLVNEGAKFFDWSDWNERNI